ncbi:hypothetical protein M3Y97_00147200 [Aphelenchoides bicaudatus]|nr:hypothetical protein M3Y97_00147200 [Aphelenchoides bicaudatus]
MSCSKLLQVPTANAGFSAFRRSSEPIMAARPRLRRIVHNLTEKGTARLIYDENNQTIRGVLINQNQDTFSVHGRLILLEDAKLMPSSTSEHLMHISIIDDESGDKYEIDGVTVMLAQFVNPVTSASHTVINIDHSALNFQTKEVLIGNRADLEIAQYIDPKLSPGANKKVLIGTMNLKVVAKRKNDTMRRVSESVNVFGSDVIEQTSDFLA